MRDYEAKENPAVAKKPIKKKESIFSNSTKEWARVICLIWTWVVVFTAVPLGAWEAMNHFDVHPGVQIFVMIALSAGLIVSLVSFMRMKYDVTFV